jgi:hypothetical protein
MSCAGLPPAAAAVAASPREDFTVSLRAAIWDGVNFNPAQAAAACSIRRGALGQTSYAARQEWLGVSHVAEGVFIAVGPNRIIQLEAVAPESKGAYARAALEEWAKKLR